MAVLSDRHDLTGQIDRGARTGPVDKPCHRFHMTEVDPFDVPEDGFDPPTDRTIEYCLMKPSKSGYPELLLDFSKVLYVDSAGISTLLALLQTARNVGGDILICSMNDRLEDLFCHVGLNHVFRRFRTRDEGIRSFTVVETGRKE